MKKTVVSVATLTAITGVAATAVSADEYTISSGDTLWGIASDVGTTVADLKADNELSSDLIFPGDVLTVNPEEKAAPAPASKETSYIVKPGDTLWAIGAEYSLDYNDIMKWNNLSSDMIYVGQELSIDESAVPAPTAAAVVEEPTVEEVAPVAEVEEEPAVEEVAEVEEEPAVEEVAEVVEEPAVEEVAEVVEEPAVEEVAEVVEEPAVEEVAPVAEVEEEPAVEEVAPVAEVEEEPAVEEVEPVVEVEEEPAVEEVEPVVEVEEEPAVEEQAAEQAEADRIAAEEQAVAKQAEADRIAAEEQAAAKQAEADRVAAEEQAAAEQAAAKQAEADRVAAEEQAAAKQAEADRIAAAEQAAAEQAEAQRAAEVQAAERAAEQAAAEQVEAEQQPAAATPAPSASNGSNYYDWGSCAWYVFEKRSSMGMSVGNTWGDATNWASSARSAGYAVNNSPSVGAIMQAPAYTNGSYGQGHVAIVERVNGDGSILVSEMQFGGGLGDLNTRTISASQVSSHNFIH